MGCCVKVILFCEVMASVAHTKHKALPWRRNVIYLCIYKREGARRAGGGKERGGGWVYEKHIRVKNESREEVTR